MSFKHMIEKNETCYTKMKKLVGMQKKNMRIKKKKFNLSFKS